MRARAIFFLGTPACSLIMAAVFAVGWIRYDLEVRSWTQVNMDSGLDSSEEGHLAEARYLRDTFILLLIAPASILAIWFVVSWIVFGGDTFRLKTIKSHFSALK